MIRPSYDFVVAGSGAGGSAVAARLFEGGARVLLLERGGEAAALPDALDAVFRYYTNGGFTAATGNCLLPIPTGSVLGGTTRINSGTCLRPPRELLGKWERSTGGGFEAAAFEGYVERAWERLGVRRAPRETMSPSSRLFLQGLERLGIGGGHLLDRAEAGCVGSGRCCFVCPTGAKRSADRAFLEPLKGRPGFELATRTELAAVEPPPRSGDPVRVRLRSREGARAVSCRALVLSCGALATPYFLRRFGLGRAHRQAGDGLSVHPAAKVFAWFDEPVRGWTGVPQGAGLEDPEEPRLRYEGVYTPPELAALTMPLEGRELRWWMERYDHLASFGFMIRDLSRGRIRYPFGRAFPRIRYDLGEEDRALMLRGMRTLARVLFAAGARLVLLPLNRRPNVLLSPEELDGADLAPVRPAELQMMAFHPLGTCGVGRVVDPDLRAAEGIYVCDGSVVPESLGVNPQITIYAFALRLADRLLGRGAGGGG